MTDEVPGAPPVIVVPCYNEQHRLDVDALLQLAGTARVKLLFVNDGSTDGTAQVLDTLAHGATTVEVIDLPVNVGKGEAVRRGLVHAMAHDVDVVGYYDADLSTPPGELLRLVDVLMDCPPGRVAVLGSRVARLGTVIERSPYRHYLGRVFASAASLALGVRVYDTQCGAKLFRVTPSLAAALERPFRSVWAFDVELLYRLIMGDGTIAPLRPDAFVEVPLEAWTAGEGSRVRPAAAVGALAAVFSMIGERKLRSLVPERTATPATTGARVDSSRPRTPSR